MEDHRNSPVNRNRNQLPAVLDLDLQCASVTEELEQQPTIYYANLALDWEAMCKPSEANFKPERERERKRQRERQTQRQREKFKLIRSWRFRGTQFEAVETALVKS
jgi:hypothetical protein